MRPGRAAALANHWVRLYTAGMPRALAYRRRLEIEADVHEQIAHERAAGICDRRIALHVASRVLCGVIADVSWRTNEIRTAQTPAPERHGVTTTLDRPAVRIAAFVLAILAIPLVGTAMSDDVSWSVFDFVLAGVLLTVVGATFDAAVRRRGNLFAGGAAAALGLAAAVLGEVDDAPGLIILGALLLAGGGAVAYRQARDLR